MLEWTRKWVEVGRERDVRDRRRGIRREKQRKCPPTWMECTVALEVALCDDGDVTVDDVDVTVVEDNVTVDDVDVTVDDLAPMTGRPRP